MNDCLNGEIQTERPLIIASNRGPVTFDYDEEGELKFQRGSGGLVTALSGLVRQINATWIACAQTDADREWEKGTIPLLENGGEITVRFLSPSEEAYEGYYNLISNPLLWFLQHSMWDVPRAPVINRETWDAWEEGYVQVNHMFANEIASVSRRMESSGLIMLQDYHLYLTARYLQDQMHPRRRPTILHFVHIPWPGPEYWGILPPAMRQAILDGLCAVDVLGFQTKEDGLNFIRTCESYLPGVDTNYTHNRIWHRNHATHVRDFPISVDVEALKQIAASEDTMKQRIELFEEIGELKLILRIDRIEPSKNIIRGFQAFDEMLEQHPEHRGEVKFLALLVPSRMDVDEYQDYLDDLMAAAGRVNAKYGDGQWEPVRLITSENYPRAIAAMQMYDVLLINAISDGMNLVAKEGPIVNHHNGALILSERAGARQQLESGAIVISPCDVYATAEALHQALTMPEQERNEKASRLKKIIEREDINAWLCHQLDAVDELNL